MPGSSGDRQRQCAAFSGMPGPAKRIFTAKDAKCAKENAGKNKINVSRQGFEDSTVILFYDFLRVLCALCGERVLAATAPMFYS